MHHNWVHFVHHEVFEKVYTAKGIPVIIDVCIYCGCLRLRPVKSGVLTAYYTGFRTMHYCVPQYFVPDCLKPEILDMPI